MSASSYRTQGWSAPVAVPGDLLSLRGPRTGVVRLPLRVYSSGAGPAQEFDLDDPAARASLYAIVLENGDEDDVAAWVDLGELRRLWPTLWLSPHVRRAWEPRLAALTPDHAPARTPAGPGQAAGGQGA